MLFAAVEFEIQSGAYLLNHATKEKRLAAVNSPPNHLPTSASVVLKWQAPPTAVYFALSPNGHRK